MIIDDIDFYAKQLRHFLLAEPEGFILKDDFNMDRSVGGGIKDDFILLWRDLIVQGITRYSRITVFFFLIEYKFGSC